MFVQGFTLPRFFQPCKNIIQLTCVRKLSNLCNFYENFKYSSKEVAIALEKLSGFFTMFSKSFL